MWIWALDCELEFWQRRTILFDELHASEVNTTARLRNVDQHPPDGLRDDGSSTVDLDISGAVALHAVLGVKYAVRLRTTDVNDQVLRVHVENFQQICSIFTATELIS